MTRAMGRNGPGRMDTLLVTGILSLWITSPVALCFASTRPGARTAASNRRPARRPRPELLKI